MNLDEIWKNAWSKPPGTKMKGQCIATITKGNQNYYFYESDQQGKYWYESDSSRKMEKFWKEYEQKKKEERRKRACRNWSTFT